MLAHKRDIQYQLETCSVLHQTFPVQERILTMILTVVQDLLIPCAQRKKEVETIHPQVLEAMIQVISLQKITRPLMDLGRSIGKKAQKGLAQDNIILKLILVHKKDILSRVDQVSDLNQMYPVQDHIRRLLKAVDLHGLCDKRNKQVDPHLLQVLEIMIQAIRLQKRTHPPMPLEESIENKALKVQAQAPTIQISHPAHKKDTQCQLGMISVLDQMYLVLELIRWRNLKVGLDLHTP